MRVFDYLRPLCEVTVPKESSRAVLSIMIKENIPFGKVSPDGDGYVFSARVKDAPRIRAAAERVGAEVIITPTGAFAFIKKYRRRLGLLVGAAVFAAALFLSSRFVWDIKISGNERVPTDVIEAALGEHGLYLGARKSTLNAGDICRRMTVGDGGISWMSIDLRGTVAYVEVRETVAADVVSTAQPSNLVASCDGQIVSVTAYGGKSEVRAGQTVRKGDVLVSGVIDSEALGYRLVRARGEVIANVTKRFSASAPLETVEKVTTGNVKTEKTIKIFSKKAELFKKTNISFEKYDTIEKTERLSIFGVRLPVFVTTVTYAEYVERPLTRTEDKAREIALAEAEKTMLDGTEGDKIVSVYQSVTFGGGECRVELIVECQTNIAEEQIIQTEKK